MTQSPALTVGNIAVRQHAGLFSLNDLHQAAGSESKHQPAFFLRNDQTQALIAELKAENLPTVETVIGKGKAQGTYACRELVIAYAAWISAAFHLKVIRVFLAVATPTTPYSVQRGQTLSTEQAEALRNLLTSHVQKLPKPQQGKAMVQGWSKLKAHFGTDYRHIPAGEFHEAVSIIARHIVDWELVDETPALPHQPTVPEIVAEWVEKIEQPNGYPAMLFMPLVNAVLRKMGFTSPGSELPRLTMTVAPPPIGSYKYDRANPYPRNGRTIEVAKSIVADICNWSDNLPAGPAKRDLHNATDTLYDLLVSGWTEVDEALGQLSTAMHYLNRWQGRGGRMGNVS